MANTEKTVFISYRRDTSSYLARAIYQDLRHNGYDVFMDVESIDSGTFDTIILNQIAARVHFIVILEPGSEKRLAEQGDWLRREIERAIELKRNVVPILASNFSFTDATPHLSGKLKKLSRYNGVPLHRDYFEEAMERLRSRFLKKPVSVTVVATPAIEREIVKKKTDEASKLPAPKPKHFTAEFLLNRGNEKYSKGDFTDAIQDFSEAIALDSKYATVYNNRGLAYRYLGQYDKAVKDYDRAIALDPKLAEAYNNRGTLYSSSGQHARAIKDFDQAIALDAKFAEAYNNRGNAHGELGRHARAIKDFDRAIALDPKLAKAYNNRGIAYADLGQHARAIKDYDRAIALDPKLAAAYYIRGLSYDELGQYDKAVKDYDRAIALDPKLADN